MASFDSYVLANTAQDTGGCLLQACATYAFEFFVRNAGLCIYLC